MKCPKCNSNLRKVMVRIEGAKTRIGSNQCPKCEYFNFDKKNQDKILEELRQEHLKIKQKVIKLSSNRLGIYFNKHIINSLNIKAGEEISVTVPDKKHILLTLKD